MDCSRCSRRFCICCGNVYRNPCSSGSKYQTSPWSSGSSINIIELQPLRTHARELLTVEPQHRHRKTYAKDDSEPGTAYHSYAKYEEAVQDKLTEMYKREKSANKTKDVFAKLGLATAVGVGTAAANYIANKYSDC
ncbi:hypothetical protein QE152_g31126 [Popillia japonica]|uniref:Uncharacterized protein n=1 Tax=Popillia japonica TaxID=7064 RepID=A0AAW1JC21_POPJA